MLPTLTALSGGVDTSVAEVRQRVALGLDEVYLQAKKYAAGTTVGEGDLRNFAGVIDAVNTTKGVFVTTAGFTRFVELVTEGIDERPHKVGKCWKSDEACRHPGKEDIERSRRSFRTSLNYTSSRSKG